MREGMHEEGAEHVHVPQQSYAPIIVATGIFLALLFFVFGTAPAVLGLIVFIIGLAQWIREDVRYFHGER